MKIAVFVEMMGMSRQKEVVIVGGGTAGISVVSRLTKRLADPDICVIEPDEGHYYQPLWTLNGAGIGNRKQTRRPQSDVIPPDVDWLQDAVEKIDPEHNQLVTRGNTTVEYGWLILAPGIQLDWDEITGLEGNVGSHGICSNYSYDTVDTTRRELESFDGGRAVFTMPTTPVKCPGAPQKIVYLADEVFRENGVREDTEITFLFPGDSIFGVEKYAEPLRNVIDRKDIDVRYETNLVELNPEHREATYEDLTTGETVTLDYDMIHVTPPQSGPDFLASSGLTDEEGWVAVDEHTLRHREFDNVFSLGDASNLPTSKTGAAVRKQVPVLVDNLLSARKREELTERYNGYTACPLVTSQNTVVMAEFDYEGNPRETFPVDQGKERRSMFWVKRYLLPVFYWWIMLKGRG
jgi:sulfide:quinone oxidoreductase